MLIIFSLFLFYRWFFGILRRYKLIIKGKIHMKINSKTLIMSALFAVAGLSFSACTGAQTPAPQAQKPQPQVPAQPQMTEEEKQAAYKTSMREVGMTIKKDANYKKLDLSTPELKSWFTDITYKFWDHQISRGQFIAAGLEKYPDRAYEFEVIANGLKTR